MSENIVFFQGKTQYENTGDVLINKSLIHLLKGHSAIIINDKEMPEWYVTSLGLSVQERVTGTGGSFNRKLIAMAWKSRFDKKAKRVFLIAGPPGHQFGNSVKKAARNVVSGFYFSLLNVLGVKVIKIGFSLGPIGPAISFSEKFRSLFTQYYLVRDSLSLKLSQDIGIRKAAFFPDLAWLYHTTKLDGGNVKRNKVILSFRHAVIHAGADDQYLIRLKLHLFSILKSLGPEFDIHIIYQVKRDYNFSRLLYDELRKEIDVSFNEEQITLENADATYGTGVCVLTNRLHVALLGYKYGALPLILTDPKDHLKIKGIYKDAGAEQLLLDVQTSAEHTIRQFSVLLNDRNRLMQDLEKKETLYKELSRKTFETIFES